MSEQQEFTVVPRGGQKAPEQHDYQTATGTAPDTGLVEVLTERKSGARTVFRLRADSQEDAVAALDLDDDVRVFASAAAGAGLGSGDPAD
jgi:hypothetical protein